MYKSISMFVGGTLYVASVIAGVFFITFLVKLLSVHTVPSVYITLFKP